MLFRSYLIYSETSIFWGELWIVDTIVITDEIQSESTYSPCDQNRIQLLIGSIADDVKQKIFDIANAYGYEIIAIETDKDHIHFLLSYDTTDKVCDIVKIVKQETTYYLWHKYGSLLSKQYWKKKIFWSDGYFACSIGEVSSTTIQKYIENQG